MGEKGQTTTFFQIYWELWEYLRKYLLNIQIWGVKDIMSVLCSTKIILEWTNGTYHEIIVIFSFSNGEQECHICRTLSFFIFISHFAAVVGRGILLSPLHLFVIFASSSGSLCLQNIFTLFSLVSWHISLFGLV